MRVVAEGEATFARGDDDGAVVATAADDGGGEDAVFPGEAGAACAARGEAMRRCTAGGECGDRLVAEVLMGSKSQPQAQRVLPTVLKSSAAAEPVGGQGP